MERTTDCGCSNLDRFFYNTTPNAQGTPYKKDRKTVRD